MKLHISAHVQSEEFVRTIIKNTKLDDLSELKSLTDSKGDFNSMHKLVYIDIRSQQVLIGFFLRLRILTPTSVRWTFIALHSIIQ